MVFIMHDILENFGMVHPKPDTEKQTFLHTGSGNLNTTQCILPQLFCLIEMSFICSIFFSGMVFEKLRCDYMASEAKYLAKNWYCNLGSYRVSICDKDSDKYLLGARTNGYRLYQINNL